MTRRYAGDNFPVYELWSWYRRQIAVATDAVIPARWWAFGAYKDGHPIEKAHRVLYRNRADLQAEFPDPYAAGPGGFRAWLVENEA